MKFNSSRCDEKLRGSVKPFLFEISLKDVVNAGERSNLLIFSGGIYVHEPGSAHSNNGESPLSNGLTGGSHELTGPRCIV